MKLLFFISLSALAAFAYYFMMKAGRLKYLQSLKERSFAKHRELKYSFWVDIFTVVFMAAAYFANDQGYMVLGDVLLAVLSGVCLINSYKAAGCKSFGKMTVWFLIPVVLSVYMLWNFNFLLILVLVLILVYLWQKAWKIYKK